MKIKKSSIEKRFLATELRAKSEDSRVIYGYAAKFDKWSEPIWGMFREKIAPGAFDKADMDDVIMCFNHNTDDIMARTESGTLSLLVDKIGLRFEFEAPNTSIGNDCLELVRRGDISKCSFAFIVKTECVTYATEENKLKYDERIITEFDKIYDTALVVRPAYSDTEASARYLEERTEALKPPEVQEESALEDPPQDTTYRDRQLEVMRMVENQ